MADEEKIVNEFKTKRLAGEREREKRGEKGFGMVVELWVNKPCCGGSAEGPITRSRTSHRSAHHIADWQGEKGLEEEVEEVSRKNRGYVDSCEKHKFSFREERHWEKIHKKKLL